MNIYLKNRTIFSKILLGFMLILLLSALMGGVLFSTLWSVTGALRRITERNAPSIQYPTAVERHVLRAIPDIRDYLLLRKKETHEQTARDIQAIYDNLDRVDEVAAKYNDRGLFQKSSHVRRALREYQDSYDRGLALLGENRVLERNMGMLGRRLLDLSRTHTLEHDRLLEEAIADGLDQRKHMAGLRLSRDVQIECLQARRHEKNFILYKKQEHLGELKEHIANIMKLVKQVSRADYVPEHQPLIAETSKATNKYLRAVEKWAANDNELRDILARIQEIGLKVQQTAQAIQEAGWQEMDTSKKSAVLAIERALPTSILVGVVTLIMGILCAFFIARGIAGPIKELNRATRRIAEGDLKHRVAVKTRDEVGELAASFNMMTQRLQDTMVSRDYFDNVIRSMIDTLIVLDVEARIQTVNPATCDLLGYTEEELVGRPVSTIFAEEEEEEEVYRVFQFFREPEKTRALRSQDTIRNRELTYKTKDGRRIPMLFNASVLADEAGKVTGVVAGAKDITDLKLAEAELRKEKTFSENIIATVPDALLVLDKELRIKRANLSFYRVFGTEPEKVIGARITDMLGDEDGGLASELSRLFGTEDMVEDFELHYQIERLDERIFNIMARCIIFAAEEEEEEEEEEEVLVVLQDITERKRAEEELRESRQKYRVLLENLPCVVYRGYKDWSIEFIDEKIESLTGYNAEEFNSRRLKWCDLIVEEDIETVERAFVQALKTDNSYVREYRIKTKQGQIRWIEGRGRIIYDQNGEIKYVDGVFFDITDRKKAREELKDAYRKLRETQRSLIQSEKMAALGRFTSGIAHELNNPLGIILGGVEFMERRLSGADEGTRTALEKTRDATLRAADIVKALLRFSRPAELKFEKLRPREFIEEAVSLFEYGPKLTRVKITTQFSEEDLHIEVDRNQMEQVVFSLLANAVDAMPKGGEIKISAYGAQLAEFAYGESCCVIEIQDMGEGISKEDLEKVFEPFFTTKRAEGGTGLGLPLSKEIIEHHNGMLTIESEPGKGTKVKVILPLAREN